MISKIKLRDLFPKSDPLGGAIRSSKTPAPIRKALIAANARQNQPSAHLPKRLIPWRRITVLALAGIVIGNAFVTLMLYFFHKPQVTAWTGTVPQSTPSAVNDLLLGIVNFVLILFILRRP